LDAASDSLDVDEAFLIFKTHLSSLSHGRCNYIRGTSDEAARLYKSGLTLSCPDLGQTTYSGQIALLHIDGNHSFEHANQDAELWTPFVMPGGFVIIDDYVWAFGDGPKRVGDAYLQAFKHRISTCFVMGTALFIQLNPT